MEAMKLSIPEKMFHRNVCQAPARCFPPPQCLIIPRLVAARSLSDAASHSTRTSATLSSPQNQSKSHRSSGIWPLEANFNEDFHPEVELYAELGDRIEKLRFILNTGTPFTTLGYHSLGKLRVMNTTTPMKLNGIEVDVGPNGLRDVNLLGNDFLLSCNAIVEGDYTGKAGSGWKLSIQKGDEPFQKFTFEEDEVRVQKPELELFEGVIDKNGWAWIKFPVDANAKSIESSFILDTASQVTWIPLEELLKLGFNRGDFIRRGDEYVAMRIAGGLTDVFASESNPSLAGKSILGTNFFSDAGVKFRLDYESKIVKLH